MYLPLHDGCVGSWRNTVSSSRLGPVEVEVLQLESDVDFAPAHTRNHVAVPVGPASSQLHSPRTVGLRLGCRSDMRAQSMVQTSKPWAMPLIPPRWEPGTGQLSSTSGVAPYSSTTIKRGLAANLRHDGLHPRATRCHYGVGGNQKCAPRRATGTYCKRRYSCSPSASSPGLMQVVRNSNAA